MEPGNPYPYQYFDLTWLKELSATEGKMIEVTVRSFLEHLPEMLDHVQLAVYESSPEKLYDAVVKVSSLSSLFTKRDFSHRFLAMKSDEENRLSSYTLAQVTAIMKELKVLLLEVQHYQKTELTSQKDYPVPTCP